MTITSRCFLTAVESGLALLGFGGERLARVVGPEHADVAFAFERDVAGKIHPLCVDEVSLQCAQRYRRRLRQPAHDRLDLSAKSIVGKYSRDDPVLQRVGRVELSRKKVKFASARRADDSRETPRTAHIARHADIQERDVEARRLRGKPEIARERPSE